LKRFSPGASRFSSKLSTHVDVPSDTVDLTSFGGSSQAKYDLYGVSNHSGTLYGGHYTAACRHPRYPAFRGQRGKDTWHTYNDRMVSPSSKDNVISYEAYLLFFERREDVQIIRTDLNGHVNDDNVEDEDEVEEGDEEW